jgi:hypothetical protein
MKIREKAIFMFLLFLGIVSTFAEASPSESSGMQVYQSSKSPLVYTPDFPWVSQEPHVDPELLTSVGLTRVLILVGDDTPIDEVAKYLLSMRVTPSFKGFYIIRGLVMAEDVEQLAANVSVLAILKDREINYDVPTEFPTIPSIKEAFNQKSAKFLQSTRESFLGKPETTLREVVNITGARDVWETYDINGSHTTIAIVDGGVDYRALSLGYWDVMAKDSMGFPAAFDADGECMAFTTIALNAYSTGMGDFIPTTFTDPLVYFSGDVYRFSELTLDFLGIPMLWPGDMNVTGIESKSGIYHFGLMFQYLFYFDILPVLVVDSVTPGVYDTAYVDLSFEWAWLNYTLPPPYNTYFGVWPPDYSFTDELPLTPTGWTIAARDFTGDGIYDLSAGSLGYFLDVWGLSPNADDRGLVLKPIAEDGDYVVFVNDWFGHGTSCASCAVGRDVGLPPIGPGMAPGAKVMSVTALFIGDIIEAELWAAGFDLIIGTEGWKDVTGYGTVWGTWNYTGNHKADIISNSWGFSDWAEWFATLGLPWYDVLTVFEDALTVPGYLDPEYPGSVIVHAGGNGGAGYGTFTEPGYGTLPISVGASTSLNWTQYEFGFAGGTYDDVIPWSARGPTPLGNVKPDVVNVGAFGWVSGPTWYGVGDGSLAFDLFGGTSMATPLTAGASALVIQGYNETKGGNPTPEATKVILKSSAKDLGYDSLVQGAGRVDTLAAVELARGLSGVSVFSPVSWDNIRPRIENAWSVSYMYLGEPLLLKPPTGPITDVNWFAGAVPPGSSATVQFTIENTATQPVTANLTPVVHRQIGATQMYSGYTDELSLDWQLWDWYWGNLTVLNLADIPEETEMMVVSLTVPYEYFDQDRDYLWDRRWGLCVLDWVDDGDGEIGINEVYLLNYGYNVGTSNEARVGFPLSKINGRPVIFIYQREVLLDSVPFDVYIKYYERSDWTWVNTPATVAVAANSSEIFIANLTVPADTPQGVYQGQIKINIEGSYNRTLAVPVSLQVPAILSTDDLVYDIISPSTIELYDPYSVNGYFDWGWRYEAGDWKQWLFDVQDPSVVAAFVSCNWTENMTDIDMFGIDPTGAIIDGAMSLNLYDGCFLWSTRTGTSEEFVLLSTSPLGKTVTGLYTVLLHNVLFNGTVFPETISGKVELVKLTPSGPISLTARSGHSTSQNFTIATGRKLTNATAYPYSPFPAEITPRIIPEINATDSAEFDVRIDVPEDTLEGTYPVFVLLVSDEMSYPITILISVTVDNTSPTVNVVSPKNGSVLSGDVSIEAYANDPSGIEKVEFEVETTSSQMTFDSNSGHWIGTLDTTTLTDSEYSLGVTAFDKAGNNHTTFVWIAIDNTNPYAIINAPMDYGFVHDEVVINITATDANLDKAQLYISGRLAATWNTSGTHTYAWNTTTYTDGTYKVALNVQDKAGNLATTEIAVTVDNTVPLAEIREPENQGFLRGIFNVTTWVYDINVDAVQLEVNGSVIDTWSLSGLHFYAWNTTALTDGVYVIKLIVYDTALNMVEKTVTITVDNTPPSVSITSPTSGAEVSGDVTIQFSASDEHLLLHIDNTILNVTEQTSYVWDTTQVGDGPHTIKLVAYDKAGNSAETSISVVTINVRLEKEFTRGIYLAIGTPLGFIIGAIIVYAFVKRRFPS